MNSKISIIIPVYNTSIYLKRCLDSVIKQSFNAIEIICVNDGSTDNSLEIITEYQSKDSRITIIDQKNQGLSAARNNGIKAASCDYLLFIDSDDTIHTDLCKEAYNTLQNDGSDIVFFQLNSVNNEGNTIRFSKTIPQHKEDLLYSLMSLQITTSASSFICKKSLFTDNKIEFPLQKLYEDTSTTYKLCYFAKKISSVNQALYNYYIENEGSITNNFSRKHIDDMVFSILDNKRFLQVHQLSNKYHHIFEYRLFMSFQYLLKNLLQNCVEKQDNIELLLYLWSNINQLKNDLHYSKFYMLIFLTLQSITDEQLQILYPTINIEKNNFNRIKEACKSTYNLGILSTILYYLKRNNIKEFYVYGIGETFTKIEPILKKNNYTILGIIDREAKEKELYVKSIKVQEFYEICSSLNNTHIIVLSQVFAQEITEEIQPILNKQKVKVISYYTAINDI
jgi:glycosyltransferase involved in cell wall biosynthesis